MITRLLLALTGLACIGAHRWYAFGKPAAFRPDQNQIDEIFKAHLGVLGLALLALTALLWFTHKVRRHTDRPAWKIVLLGVLFGTVSGLVVAIAVPPEAGEGREGLAFVYRVIRVVLFAGMIGAGIYIMLQLVSGTTNRAVIPRAEQILAMVLAFSAVFVFGVWVSRDLPLISRVLNAVSFGAIDWVGSGQCLAFISAGHQCLAELGERSDTPEIAATMLALFFFLVALFESRRWRLSFARTLLMVGGVVVAGVVLIEVVDAVTALAGKKAPRIFVFGPLLAGLAAYSTLFSFWMTFSRHHSLVEALCDAYGSTDAFRAMTEARLAPQYGNAPRQDSLEAEVRGAVDRAERNGWLEELVVNARFSRPDHVKLARIADQRGLGIGPPRIAQVQGEARRIDDSKPVRKVNIETLEKMTRKFSRLGLDERREKEAKLETRVCCVVTPTNEGTGWLVGPDIVLTNYHVVKDMIGDGARVRPEHVFCRFDYKGINKGSEYRLKPEGAIIDWSPFHGNDLKDSDDPPPVDHLDFALLRLEQPAGRLPIGTNAEPGAPARGWISLRNALRKPEPNHRIVEDRMQLYVLQHPFGEPLKGEFGAVIQINANGTRIRHEVTTERGSSGSPCFDFADLEPFALHHAGNHSRTLNLPYNQAIPIGRIIRFIKERNTVEAFWDMAPSEAEKPFGEIADW
jgi:hypothetical protein